MSYIFLKKISIFFFEKILLKKILICNMSKINSSIFLLCFSALFRIFSSSGLRCAQFLNNDAFFSLEPLSSESDYQDTFIAYAESYRLYYNFCRLTIRKCNEKSSYAVLFKLDKNNQEINDSCTHLTSDNILSNFEYELQDQDDPAAGINLKLVEGDIYAEGDLHYQITFQISCDKTSNSKFHLDEILEEHNTFFVKGRSSSGCPIVQISEVYQFILDYKYIFGIISILIGIFECFFGLALLKPSLFCIGYLSGFGFLILIFGEFVISPSSSILFIWLLLLISVLFGAISGFLATSLPKFGFMALGFWFGIILAFLINNLFLYKIEVEPPGLLLYITMFILGITFGLMSMFFWQNICIISSSFLGAYLIIRSLSLYIGYYPNELSLNYEIKYKELEDVGWEFYIYFLFLIILAIFGAIIQFRNKKKIGGRFAGNFDKADLETFGEKYVEMEIMEENTPRKNHISLINERNEESEVSKKTCISKKSGSQVFLKEKSGLKDNLLSKSAKTSNLNLREELKENKSFQDARFDNLQLEKIIKKSFQQEAKKNSNELEIYITEGVEENRKGRGSGKE